MKRILVIFNERAGKGRVNQNKEAVRKFYSERGISTQEISSPDDSTVVPPDWQLFDTVVICGGDGTLHRIANFWGIPPIPVTLLQLGSGNDFGRETNGAVSLDEQLLASIGDNIILSDAGLCNGKIFFTGVGIGFDGLVAEKIAGRKWLRGHAAYYYTVLQYLFLYREKQVKVVIDNDRFTENSFMLTVGNTPAFGGGFRITPLADPADSLFDICLVKKVNLLERVMHLGKVKKGNHLHLSCVRYEKTSHVSIRATQELPCHMDGECYAWDHFDIILLPAAIQLKVWKG